MSRGESWLGFVGNGNDGSVVNDKFGNNVIGVENADLLPAVLVHDTGGERAIGVCPYVESGNALVGVALELEVTLDMCLLTRSVSSGEGKEEGESEEEFCSDHSIFGG